MTALCGERVWAPAKTGRAAEEREEAPPVRGAWTAAPATPSPSAELEWRTERLLWTAAELTRAGRPEAALRMLAGAWTRLGFMPLVVVSSLVDLCLALKREQEAAVHCLEFGREALALGYDNLGMEAVCAAMVFDAAGEYRITRNPRSLRDVARLYEQVAQRHEGERAGAAVRSRAPGEPLRMALIVPNLVDHVVAYTKCVLQLARAVDPARFRLRVYVSENSARRDAPLFPAGCTNPGSERTGAATLARLRELGIPVWVAPRSLRFVEAAGALAQRIEEDGTDIAILQSGIAFPIDWLAMYWARVPVKVGIHIGSSLFLPGMDATFYDNPANIEREAAVWEPEMGARLLLRLGTDLDALQAQRPLDRARFGIPADAVVVGTLSNHLPRRLSAPYLEVIAAALRACPHAWFLAFGADTVPAAMSFFAERGVAERVRFGGRRERAGEALKGLDVYANEFPVGGSQSVIEAMACGVPVVAMKWGDGHPESAAAEIVGGRHAIPGRDPAAYAALLHGWMVDPAARAAAARDMQERAQKLFSARTHANLLCAAAEDLFRKKQAC